MFIQSNGVLFVVINHHGSRLQGGHYTTNVFHEGLNSWIHIVDELVRTVRFKSMLTHQPTTVPYLLFYRRIE
jgi:ubiquitin carboxyl-terminal hydrolase 10